jgi:hypothetical protein
VGATDLQAWEFAAERSGAAQGALVKGLRRLQKNVLDARDGLTTATRSFQEINVEWLDSQGNLREMADLLPDVADRFSKMESSTTKSAIAQNLFGRAGNELLPFLEEGSSGLAELRARFDELGGGLDVGFLARAEEAQDALTDFDLAARGLKSTIATEILPIITRATARTAEFIAMVRETTKDTALLEIGFIALGAAAVAAGAAIISSFIVPIATVLLAAAAITVVLLVVEDLVAFFEGRESLTGGLLTAMGVDADDVRKRFKQLFEVAKEFWGETFPALMSEAADRARQTADIFTEVWGEAFDTLSSTIKRENEVFGEFWDSVLGGGQNTFSLLTEAWEGFALAVKNGVLTIGEGLDRISGFLGIDIGGTGALTAGEPVTQQAAGPALPIAPGASSSTQTVQVTNDVTVNAGGDVAATEAAVRRALDESNARMLRGAQRALTQVAE